jgi:hypothetical protein
MDVLVFGDLAQGRLRPHDGFDPSVHLVEHVWPQPILESSIAALPIGQGDRVAATRRFAVARQPGQNLFVLLQAGSTPVRAVSVIESRDMLAVIPDSLTPTELAASSMV